MIFSYTVDDQTFEQFKMSTSQNLVYDKKGKKRKKFASTSALGFVFISMLVCCYAKTLR